MPAVPEISSFGGRLFGDGGSCSDEESCRWRTGPWSESVVSMSWRSFWGLGRPLKGFGLDMRQGSS